jgi:hypothetical protein
MLETLQLILTQAAGHLRYVTTTYMPLVLAALTILLVAFVCALVARWVLNRIFKGIAFDRWLRHSGVSSVIAPSRNLRPTRIVGETAFWLILAVGLVTALGALNTTWTSAIAESLVFFFPKLAAGAALLLGGILLAHYLARGTLVWAVNEELPAPRRLAMAVRAVVLLVTIVAVADYLNFARGVFLSAFILILGGAVMAGSLALGLGGRDAVRAYLQERHRREEGESAERSVWSHL